MVVVSAFRRTSRSPAKPDTTYYLHGISNTAHEGRVACDHLRRGEMLAHATACGVAERSAELRIAREFADGCDKGVLVVAVDEQSGLAVVDHIRHLTDADRNDGKRC